MIAISTSQKEALIAVEIQGKKKLLSMDSSCKHSENLLFNIDKMLDELGLSIKDNDSFAVIIGPGSFTGIRIGIALVKGFCSGIDKPVVPIYSFELLACAFKKSSPSSNFYCAINGLSGMYFVQKFNKDALPISEPQICTLQELNNLDTPIVSYAEEQISDITVTPTPEDLLMLAKQKQADGKTISAKNLTPFYMRKSQAEADLDAKKNGKKN